MFRIFLACNSHTWSKIGPVVKVLRYKFKDWQHLQPSLYLHFQPRSNSELPTNRAVSINIYTVVPITYTKTTKVTKSVEDNYQIKLNNQAKSARKESRGTWEITSAGQVFQDRKVQLQQISVRKPCTRELFIGRLLHALLLLNGAVDKNYTIRIICTAQTVGKSSHEITKNEATPVRINDLEDSTLQAATIEY